jgi:hypothetical protein
MSTIEPEVIEGGRRIEGNSIFGLGQSLCPGVGGMLGRGCTSRLSSVRSTATPASTLPTVRETSIVMLSASLVKV